MARKFDTSFDSAGLTTLAGLGLLAYMDSKGKDKSKAKEDKAAEALKEAAKPEEKKVEPAKPEPAPEPQSKEPISKKVATNTNVAKGIKPPPAYKQAPELKNWKANEDRPSQPYPTELAAKNKAAAEAKSKVAPAKTTAPTKDKTPQGRMDYYAAKAAKDKPALGKTPQGRAEYYADKRKKEEMRNRSLASQMDASTDMKKGGAVRSTASRRGDGIAKRGFTKA